MQFFCKQKGVSVPVLRTPLNSTEKKQFEAQSVKTSSNFKTGTGTQTDRRKGKNPFENFRSLKKKKRSKIQNIPPVHFRSSKHNQAEGINFIKKMKMKMNWRKRLRNGMYQTKFCQRSEKGKLWKTKTLNGNKYMPLEQSHQEIDQQISMPLKPKGEANSRT